MIIFGEFEGKFEGVMRYVDFLHEFQLKLIIFIFCDEFKSLIGRVRYEEVSLINFRRCFHYCAAAL